MRQAKIRKNPGGNYPHYGGDTQSEHAIAYSIVTKEAIKMTWNLIKTWRKKPFRKSVLNYSIRRALNLITTHLEHNENHIFKLSTGARDLEASQDGILYRHQVISEHPVPMKVIIQMMIDKATSAEDCYQILNKWSRVTFVTKEEDALLNAKYMTNMPEDWDGEDVWARYRKVGIVVVSEDY